MVVHYQNWLAFAYTNLPVQNFIPSQREKKTYWKKLEKTSLVVHLSFLHAKQLLRKLLSEGLQIDANLLLGLMPANHTPTRCTNPCPPVFKRVGVSIHKLVDSHLDKSRPVALKIRSWLIFNVQDLIVKLRASKQQADRKKLIASVSMGFVVIAILNLKQWVAFTTFVPVKISAHLSLKKISDVAVGIENSMNSDEAIYRRKVSMSLKWWRLYKTITIGKLHIPENFPHRRSLTEQQLPEEIKKGNLFGYVQCNIEVP